MKSVSPKKQIGTKSKTKISSLRGKTLITKAISAKRPSPLLKKIKRSSKQAIRSMLLSPAFHTSFKIFTGLLISGGLFYGSYLAIGKSFANEVVISKSEIVSRVSKLTNLPDEEPYDLVRVQDPENLKQQNEFYKDIEEGDYILMYKEMAVIYNLRNNSIVAVKQAQINR